MLLTQPSCFKFIRGKPLALEAPNCATQLLTKEKLHGLCAQWFTKFNKEKKNSIMSPQTSKYFSGPALSREPSDVIRVVGVGGYFSTYKQ
jgi:hypothetical protein